MESLHSAMFVWFKKDDVIFPPESAIFEEMAIKDKKEKEIKMEATELYKNDNLGLKFLKDDGTWASIAGGGDLLASNNLSDVTNQQTSINNMIFIIQ